MISPSIHLFNNSSNSRRGDVNLSINLAFDRSEVFNSLLTANQQVSIKEKSVVSTKSTPQKIATQQNKHNDTPPPSAVEHKDRSTVKSKQEVSTDDKSSLAENNNGIEQTSQTGVVSDQSQDENKNKLDQSPSEIDQAEQSILTITQANLQQTQMYLPILAGQVMDVSVAGTNASIVGDNLTAYFALDNKSLNVVTETTFSYVSKDGLTSHAQTGQQPSKDQGFLADNGKFFNQTMLSQFGLDALAEGRVSGDNEPLGDEFALLQAALPKAAKINGATPIIPVGLDFTNNMSTGLFMENNDRYLSTMLKPGGAALSSQVFTLPTQVGQPGWGGEFSKRITMMFNHNVQQATLRLHPQELGQIDVRISINQDQASVAFVSQHGMVKEVIEAALPKLRDMLAESGIHLTNAEVGSQSAFSRQQENAAQQNQEMCAQKLNSDDSSLDSSVDEGVMNLQSMAIKQADSLVDYFA